MCNGFQILLNHEFVDLGLKLGYDWKRPKQTNKKRVFNFEYKHTYIEKEDKMYQMLLVNINSVARVFHF